MHDIMQTYTHDYTKPSRANAWLYEALEAIRRDDTHLATEIIGKARAELDEYLAHDNMIPDDDTASGWYRAQDVDNR